MSLPPGGFPPGFEWDEAKNQVNIRKHGIDFRDAVRLFDRPTLDRADNRRDYGEVRTNSIGCLGGLVIAMVTHTDRDDHPLDLCSSCQQPGARGVSVVRAGADW